MIEYLFIALAASVILFELGMTFRETMEPAFKSFSAVIRWPIP